MATARSRRANRKRLWHVALLALLVWLLWALEDFAYVSIGAEADHTQPADVILVLGCRPYTEGHISACMEARGGHAAELYRRGLSHWVIATGDSPEGGPAESGVLREVLQGDGVPPGAIIEESKAQDTIQNIYNSRAIIEAHNWRTVLLVTEPFHINRASLIARDAGLTFYPSPALDSPNWTQLNVRIYNLGRDAVSLMLYQVKSLVGISD